MDEPEWIDVTALGDSHEIQMLLHSRPGTDEVYRHRPLTMRQRGPFDEPTVLGNTMHIVEGEGEWIPGLPPKR